MIKQLNKSDIILSPFKAIKDWELFNINIINSDLILVDIPSSSSFEFPISLDYIDYYIGNPLLDRECDIALEQQSTNKSIYEEGILSNETFDPLTSKQNVNGTYKMLVYSVINKAFYNQYHNPVEIFGMENIDFPLSQTNRYLADSFRMFNIPQNTFGDKLVEGSIKLYDTTLDDNVTISDDKLGNLIAGSYLFSKIQEVRSLGNIFVDGIASYDCPKYSDGMERLRILENGDIRITEDNYFREVITASIYPLAIGFDTASIAIGFYTGSIYTEPVTSSTPSQTLYSYYCAGTPSGVLTLSGTITPAYTSPTQGVGYYADTQSFAVSAGTEYEVWMRSKEVNAIVIVYDELGAIIVQDYHHGEEFDGDINNAWVKFTASNTATYKLEATTNQLGETGSYKFVIDFGKLTTISVPGSSIGNMMYVSSSNKIIVADGNGPTVSIIDAETNTYSNTLTNGITPVDSVNSLNYSPIQDKIYALYGRNSSPYGCYYAIITSDGSAIEEYVSSSVALNGAAAGMMAYDSKNDRILTVSSHQWERPNWAIFDCATKTEIVNGSLLESFHYMWQPCYCSSSNQFYIYTGYTGYVYKMDADTFNIVQSTLTVPDMGARGIYYLKEIDRIFVQNIHRQLCAINPADDSVVHVFTGLNNNISDIAFDTCRQEIMIGIYGWAVICFDTNYSASRYYTINNSGNYISGPVYAVRTGKTFIIDNDASTVIVES